MHDNAIKTILKMDKLTQDEAAALRKKQAMNKPKEKSKELIYLSPATRKVAQERNKQFDKGYTMEYDFNSNPPGTLSQAAKALLEFDVHKRIDSKPDGWDTYTWQKQCIKPERDRLAVAAAWCIAELDRYYFNEIEGNEKEG